MTLEPVLDQMPISIKEKIASCTDLKTRMRLRKTSRQIRNAVDNSDYQIEKMDLYIGRLFPRIIVFKKDNPTFQITYNEKPSGCSLECRENNSYNKTGILEGMNCIKTFFSDFKTFVENPKCIVKQVLLECNEVEEENEVGDSLNLRSELKQTLNSLKKKISVEDIKIECHNNKSVIIDILSSLKPGILKKVEFSVNGFGDELMALEQWMRVKEVKTRWVPVAQLLQCNKSQTKITTLTLEDVKMITETAIRRVEQFENFTVRSSRWVGRADIVRYMEREFSVVGNSNKYRYRRIGANCYLRLYTDDWRVTIDKRLAIY